MRTTVTLEADVAAAVESLRRERHVGVSAAINELIRSGLGRASPGRTPFEQRTSSMGALIDVANVADVLELLDGPASR
ncbi:ribbon-helix-helix protein, CopG family [soil metagenome]